jgi:hypothetical protein
MMSGARMPPSATAILNRFSGPELAVAQPIPYAELELGLPTLSDRKITTVSSCSPMSSRKSIARPRR